MTASQTGSPLNEGGLQQLVEDCATIVGTGVLLVNDSGRIHFRSDFPGTLIRSAVKGHSEAERALEDMEKLLKWGAFTVQLDGLDVHVLSDCLGLSYGLALLRTSESRVAGRVVLGPFLCRDQVPRMEHFFGVSSTPHVHLPNRDWQKHLTPTDETHVRAITRAVLNRVDDYISRAEAHLLLEDVYGKTAATSKETLESQNQALEKANARLKEMDEMKNAFLATVTHELRTPLTSVIGYADLLLAGVGGQLETAQHDHVSTIKDKGHELLKMISEILDITKMQGDGFRLQCERVDMMALVNEATTSVWPQAQQKNIVIQNKLDAAHMMMLDRDKFKQAIVNVIGNAVKFTEEGGEITLDLKRIERRKIKRATVNHANFIENLAARLFDPSTEHCVELTIQDNGIGMDPKSADEIFQPFVQVDRRPARRFGGTGLGLTITKSIVEAHGGEISVESALGVGTTFSIILPEEVPETERTRDEA